MCGKLATIVLAGVVALGIFSLGGLVAAHEGHDHGGASHGGVEAKTKKHHFESVFTKGGVRLYVHGADHKPVDASHLSATATFYHPSSQAPWFTRNLKPASRQASEALVLVLDLSKVPTEGAKVAFRVAGLADSGEQTATFTVPFRLADSGTITAGKATKADEKAIATQKVCPVSGEELGGEMGPPLKVTRGGKTVFLCCKNCLTQVQANPEKFFADSAAAANATTAHDRGEH
jgi:hypothetical protein